MTTKPLISQLNIVISAANDAPTINRLLAAAAINPRFCAMLLSNPEFALTTGFGGELFPLSKRTYKVLTSIKAHNLSDFVNKLNEKGVDRLS